MLRTGLEFAPNTSEDCKKLVKGLLQPEKIIQAYRDARIDKRTSDIVIFMTDQDPSIYAGTRMEFCMNLKQRFGDRASAFRMWKDSAHSVVSLPSDSEAMWLVIDARGLPLPVMCVIYATPYDVTQPSEVN